MKTRRNRARSQNITVSHSPAVPESPWVVYYPNPDGGRRLQRRFPSEKKAEAFKTERESLIAERGQGITELVSDQSALNDVAWCQEQVKQWGKTLRDVVSDWISIQNRIGKSITVSQAIAELLENKKKRLGNGRYQKDLKYKLERFKESFGSTRIVEVTATDVSTWLEGLKLSPRTVNGYYRVLKVLFSYCEKKDYITVNPVKKVDKFKEPAAPKEIWNPVELKKILSSARKEIIPALAISAFAGLRTSEVFSLTWDNIYFDAKTIHIPANVSKTGEPRDIELRDNLATWLKPYKGTGKILKVKNQYTTFTKGLKDSIGIPWRKNALRHSFCSYGVIASQDAAKIALEAGHDIAMQRKHYKAYVTKETAKEYFSILP